VAPVILELPLRAGPSLEPWRPAATGHRLRPPRPLPAKASAPPIVRAGQLNTKAPRSAGAWPLRHSWAATETKPSGERCRRRSLRQCWSLRFSTGSRGLGPCQPLVRYSRSFGLPERSARPGWPRPSPLLAVHSATARPSVPATLPVAGSIGGVSPPTVAGSAGWWRRLAGSAADPVGSARKCAVTGVERSLSTLRGPPPRSG